MAGKFWRGGACAAFIAYALGGVAQAQDPVRAAPPDGTTVLDPITVTATRNPIRSFGYPGMVTAIGPGAIRTRQASTVDDLLSFVPNVEFSGGPRRTGEVPSIRGFSGADIVVTLDGARQNFGSTHDGRFFIDPSLIERVEVLRGPASSLYGSGGTGGLIGFRTLDAADLLGPDETAGARLTGGYQSVNSERVGNVTAFATHGQAIDLLASATKRDSGTIRLGDGAKLKHTDDDILAGLAKIGVGFADHHRIGGSFITFRNNAREPNNSQEGVGGAGQTAVGLVDKGIRAQNFTATYSYGNPADSLLDLDLVAYRTGFEADELRLEDVRTGPRGELLRRDVDTTGFRLDNRSRFKPSDSLAVTLTYGAEYWRDEQDGGDGGMRGGRPDGNAGERDGVPDATARFQGLFAQAEIAVTEPLGPVSGDILIIPGLRYDDYKTSSTDGRLGPGNEETEFSPRIGASWLPTESLMLFASYAHAFRAPTMNEIFLSGTHFPLFRDPRDPRSLVGFNRFEANPDLKPQTTRTVEIGAGIDLDDIVAKHDRFRVKASHFRIRGEDFINTDVRQAFPAPANCIPFTSDRARIPAGPPGTPPAPGCEGASFSENVANAKLWGAEIEASYESARFVATIGYSDLDGEDEDTGEKLGALVLTPAQIAADIGVKLREIDSIVGWRMLAAARFDKVNDPEDERPGYTVHDLYFTWRPSDGPLKGLRADIGVDNAFDKAYSRVDTAAVEPGRNFKLSVGYSLAW